MFEIDGLDSNGMNDLLSSITWTVLYVPVYVPPHWEVFVNTRVIGGIGQPALLTLPDCIQGCL